MLPVHCDVTKEADVEAMMRAAVDEFGRLDAVLNVAGIADARDAHRRHDGALRPLMDVDLRGVLLGMKHGDPGDARDRQRRRDRQLVVDRRPQRARRSRACTRPRRRA